MNLSTLSPKILTVTSGKGGVGKTFLALQLAGELARAGSRVMLFDGDMGLANVHVLLGLQPKNTLTDVVAGKCNLSDAILPGPHGISIIPGGSGHRIMADLPDTEIFKIVKDLSDLPEKPDYLIIDTGAGIGRHVLSLSTIGDRVLVVIKDDPASLADAYGLIKVLSNEYRLQNFDIVVNDVLSEDRGNAIFLKLKEVVSRFLGVPLVCVGIVPHDSGVRVAARKRSLLGDEVSVSPGVRAIRSICNHYKSIATLEPSFPNLLDRLKSAKAVENE